MDRYFQARHSLERFDHTTPDVHQGSQSKNNESIECGVCLRVFGDLDRGFPVARLPPFGGRLRNRIDLVQRRALSLLRRETRPALFNKGRSNALVLSTLLRPGIRHRRRSQPDPSMASSQVGSCAYQKPASGGKDGVTDIIRSGVILANETLCPVDRYDATRLRISE